MNTELSQKILDATNGGLNIILHYYPQAADCVHNNKKFRVRGNEKTASANLRRLENGVYVVTDFGGDQKSRNGILVAMLEENMEFKDAMKVIIQKLNLTIDDRPPVPLKPLIERRAATETETEGSYDFKYKPEMEDHELEVIFAKGTIDYAFNKFKDDWKKHLNKVAAAYGVFALMSFTYIKDGKATVTTSTQEYPIFVIKGDGFEKIYQPKSLDKAYRFRYSGKKEKDYVFGYKRLIKNAEDLQKKWENEDPGDDEEGEKKKKGKAPQLDDVIICSGDRDSLNVAALGYNVIWLNSESAHLPWTTYLQLKKYCKSIYNLPDLDLTGVRQAHEMALKHMDIKTIALPEELKERNDWRGNACKDVRDYLQHFGYMKFDSLVKEAVEYRFWDDEHQYNKDGEYKKSVYLVNNARLYNFAMKCGFYLFESKTEKSGYHFIQIDKNIVRIIDPKTIKKFINEFLEKHFGSDLTLRNTFYRSPQLKEDSFDNLKYTKLDFDYCGRDFQYVFFQNKTWHVSPNEIIEYKPGEINKMVWEDKVIGHNVSKLEAPFELTTIEHPNGDITWDIVIKNTDCLFFKFLINASRIHWRKELEEALENKSPEEAEAYRKKHQFSIDGPNLDDAEIHEQKQHLINKLFVLGFMLCRYKEEAKAWAPFIMDYKLSDDGESHGGSGKSIFASSVEPFLNFIFINGKNKSLTDDKFAFESVTELTEMVLLDDLDKYLGIEPFFSIITGPMTVNPKHNQRFILPFKSSPRIAFTSNFGVRDVSPSAERRLLYASFSDYYHNNQTGTYQGDYTPLDEFGKNLISDFNEKEWNLFINTMVRCLQVFMKIPRKFNPPMGNILKRNLKMLMGDAFLNWADVFFSEDGGRLNTMVVRGEAFADFVKASNNKNYSEQKFRHSLAAWCRYYHYELNPPEFRNNSGRIVRKAFKRHPDGTPIKTVKPGEGGGPDKISYEKQAMEMIFVKTASYKPGDEDKHDAPTETKDPLQDDLPF